MSPCTNCHAHYQLLLNSVFVRVKKKFQIVSRVLPSLLNGNNVRHCHFSRMRKKTYLLTIASNEDLDQPAHPRSLIRVSVVRIKKRCILVNPKNTQRRFWSDCANAQTDLNLRWALMSRGMFSDVGAHLVFFQQQEMFTIFYLSRTCTDNFFSLYI